MANAIEIKAAEDGLWRKSAVAAYCAVTQRSVENWMQNGLPFIKMGNVVRFKRQDVMDFLESRRREVRN